MYTFCRSQAEVSKGDIESRVGVYLAIPICQFQARSILVSVAALSLHARRRGLRWVR